MARRNPTIKSVSDLVVVLRGWNKQTGKGQNLIAMCEADPQGFGQPFLIAVNKVIEKIEAKAAAREATSSPVAAKAHKNDWDVLAEAVEQMSDLPPDERSALHDAFVREARSAKG